MVSFRKKKWIFRTETLTIECHRLDVSGKQSGAVYQEITSNKSCKCTGKF